MNKTDIKYISLFAPLLYLYQNIFLWSKNVSMFTYSQLICSFGTIFILSALCYFIFYYLFSAIFSKIENVMLFKLYIEIFISIFVGLISNFLFLRTLFYPYHHFIMYGLIISIILVIYFNAVKYFIKFISILILIAVCSFTYNFYKNFNSSIVNTDTLLVEFKDKPNIYMVWLESYHGTKTIKNVYNIDVSPLTNFLEENNFTVCENLYSGSNATILSMGDLFSLGYINPLIYSVGKSDVYTSLRKLLAGGAGNNLLNVLKYNDYSTNVMLGGSYYFTYKEKYLDYAPIDDYQYGILNHIYPCYAFCKFSDLICKFSNSIEGFPVFALGDINKILELQINKMQKTGKPYFIALKYDRTTHLPIEQSYKERTKWIKSGLYSGRAKQSISELPKLISLIIEKDPDALIVILGDHGAHTYWGIESSKMLKDNNILFLDFLDDFYNVYGAVRLPARYEKFSFDDKDSYINHQNIFIHIFSLLAQNPEYIKLQKTPVTRFKDTNLVINGVINEDVEF